MAFCTAAGIALQHDVGYECTTTEESGVGYLIPPFLISFRRLWSLPEVDDDTLADNRFILFFILESKSNCGGLFHKSLQIMKVLSRRCFEVENGIAFNSHPVYFISYNQATKKILSVNSRNKTKQDKAGAAMVYTLLLSLIVQTLCFIKNVEDLYFCEKTVARKVDPVIWVCNYFSSEAGRLCARYNPFLYFRFRAAQRYTDNNKKT